MLVKVTQAHIDTGRAGDCSACPIALAMKEALAVYHVKVNVWSAHVYLARGEAPSVIMLPRSATRFVHRFDAHAPVKPFRFRV